MRTKLLWIGLLLALSLVVTACGGTATAPEAGQDSALASTPEASSEPAETMDREDDMAATGMEAVSEQDVPEAMPANTTGGEAEPTPNPNESETTAHDTTGSGNDPEPMATGSPPDNPETATADLPAWFSAELVDVRSGQAFTLADFQGQVVMVETMAIWCSNCLKQQKQVRALHEALGDQPDLVTVVLDIDANEDAGNLKIYADKNGFDWTYAVAPRAVAREIGQRYGDQFLNPPSTPMLIIDRQGKVHPLPFGIKSATSLEEALQPLLSDSL